MAVAIREELADVSTEAQVLYDRALNSRLISDNEGYGDVKWSSSDPYYYLDQGSLEPLDRTDVLDYSTYILNKVAKLDQLLLNHIKQTLK